MVIHIHLNEKRQFDHAVVVNLWGYLDYVCLPDCFPRFAFLLVIWPSQEARTRGFERAVSSYVLL